MEKYEHMTIIEIAKELKNNETHVTQGHIVKLALNLISSSTTIKKSHQTVCLPTLVYYD